MNNLGKKGAIVAVILLFIGLAFAPTINANVSKASFDSELVEFTTEVCGLNGGKRTIQLTKSEAEEVEQLIDDIESRLDEVETREEAVEIFNEAVVELDKYGLLGGLSIEQAQRLLTGGYQNSRMIKLLEKLNPNTSDKEENYLCLIAGDVEGIRLCFQRFFTTAILNFINIDIILLLILSITEFRHWFDISFTTGHIRVNIGFGAKFFYSPGDWINIPANGWVHTLGLNGVKTWDGSYYGQFSTKWLIKHGSYRHFMGCIGFTGIKIGAIRSLVYSFILGSALWVKLGEEIPAIP